MAPLMKFGLLASLALSCSAAPKCFDPSPAFPPPQWQRGAADLEASFRAIEEELETLLRDQKWDTSSISIELTSQSETLWGYHHTARQLNETRPGTRHVDSHSIFRIASVTKTFTTLAILHLANQGKLSLEDTVDKYIPALSGELPWKDITLRALASQLSGIPREFAQSDWINFIQDPTSVGLPPASTDGLPKCAEYNHYHPCKASDLIHRLSQESPVFAPNSRSTYSNLNFELLGLVIEAVAGQDYTSSMDETIFKPLNMTSTTFSTPPDAHAVLPAVGWTYWGIDDGVQNPTGGIYSTPSDLSKYLRYILTHFNALATGINWLMPASWSGGLTSLYGMPWEIFRTDQILDETRRPVTFVTKSGRAPGYYSRIFIMEEYGLGLNVLVGGESELLGATTEIVTTQLIRSAEHAIWQNVEKAYAGTYISTQKGLNSTITLTVSPSRGLVLDRFISNGTDVFEAGLDDFLLTRSTLWRAQLTPTLLFKNETFRQGEIWRIVQALERTKHKDVWSEFCIMDVDPTLYAGLPLNEIVFWQGQEDNEVFLELPAWKVKMKKARDSHISVGGILIEQLFL